jgi:hypothetical protein
MRRLMIRALTLLGTAGLVTLASAGPALAHEDRTVNGYDWAVGFGDEPTYAGFPNSVQLLLSKNGKPVTNLPGNLGKLKVAVQFGSQTKDLQLEPNFEVGEFGTPGDYRAFFIPTRPGTYTFHFTGTFAGSNVNESFTSGPKTFSEVDNPTDPEFPVQDPTNGELADRLTREVPRLTSAIDASRSAAEDQAATARTIAIVALVVGGIALVVGAVAVVRARRIG